MANVYDDVAELQAQMATMQSTVALLNSRLTNVEALDGQMLIEGTDLNTLECGRYIIPTVAVAQSLLNAPTGAGSYTGMIEVYCGGSGGQKIQKYTVCRKEEKLYFERCYYSNSWGAWKVFDATDTGWVGLTLASGVVAYAPTQIPQCRKIGKTVYIRGGVKGIVNDNTLVGTLPAGYRPTRVVHFLQNKTASGNTPMAARWKIESDGDIIMVFSETQSEATHWYGLDTSFLVD